MIAEKQDTDKNEEVAQQSRVALPEETGDSGNWESLKAEQVDQISGADTKVLAAIDDYGSLEDLGKLLAIHRPELLFWGGRDFLLRGQKHLIIDTNAKLPPGTEGEDIHLQTRITTYKRSKQEVAILDRLFQCASSAANIEDAVKGVRKLQDDPFIRSLDARQEITGQNSLTFGT